MKTLKLSKEDIKTIRGALRFALHFRTTYFAFCPDEDGYNDSKQPKLNLAREVRAEKLLDIL